jgi:hypothetical protein
MTQKATISYSSLMKFINCRKAFQYQYIKRLQAIGEPSYPLIFGSYVHKCLEEWYTTKSTEKLKQKAIELVESFNHSYENHSYAMDMKMEGLAMLFGYINRYPKEDFKIIALEKEFIGEIVNPDNTSQKSSIGIVGKIDGIIEDEREYLIFEHKTSKQVNSWKWYIEKLPMDNQILIYNMYAKKMYPNKEMHKSLYNILVKPKTFPKHSMETDQEYYLRLTKAHSKKNMYKREIVPVHQIYIEKIKNMLWQVAQEIELACETNAFYPNNSYCYSWGRKCDYFPLCYAKDEQEKKAYLKHYEIPEDNKEKIIKTDLSALF